MWVPSQGWEDNLEEEVGTHCSILAWKIPWTEEAGRLQPMGSQRVRHDWSDNTHTYMYSLTSDWPFMFWLERAIRFLYMEDGLKGAVVYPLYTVSDLMTYHWWHNWGCNCSVCPWIVLWPLWLLDHIYIVRFMSKSPSFYRRPIPPGSEAKRTDTDFSPLW